MKPLTRIASDLHDWHLKPGQKTPTHIYMEPHFFDELVSSCFLTSKFNEVFGLKIIICTDMPMGKKDFFLTA